MSTQVFDPFAAQNDYMAFRPCNPRQPSEFMRTRRERRRLLHEAYPCTVALPGRLDPDQRAAQIRHAVGEGFQLWEIAQLVPGPVTPSERAQVGS